MNINQALKAKNKLTSEIRELYSILHSNNSIVEGNTRHYGVEEILNKINALSGELVELKAKIHTANTPIYNKIFQLSELKAMAKNIKNLDCTEGTSNSRWGEEAVKRVVEINVRQRDEMVKNLEAQIEAIQNELDAWNYTTQI